MAESLIEFANKIRNHLDITEIVGEYVHLNKSGANHKGVCPFHKEKTPSFMVSRTKQIFHCFGCGAGGDVVAFVRKIENLGFKEALILLAQKANIEVPSFSTKVVNKDAEHQKDVIFEINEIVKEYFIHNLKDQYNGKIGRDYIQKRGISEEITKEFKIGLASSEWEDLLKLLKSKGYSESIILNAGLISPRGSTGGYYDKFRNRLIFPIFDMNNRVVAFGGRALDDAPAKYMNSPDTPIYRKSEHLYGLNIARNEIKEKDFVIVVEGYMDLIAAHQFGFKNTTATLGTALTQDQTRLLKRFTSNVIFIYDGDEAGQNAMIRGCEILIENDLSPKIAVLPPKEDPDSLLHKEGREPFDKLVKSACGYLEFFLNTAQKKYDKNTVDGKVEIINFISPMINNISNTIKKYEAIRQTSETLKIDEALLQRYLKKWSGKDREDITQDIRITYAEKPDICERMILKILLDHPDLKKLLPNEFSLNWFFNETIKKWIWKILKEEQTIAEDIQSILNKDENNDEKQIMSDILFWDLWDESFDENADKILSEHIVRLNIKYKKWLALQKSLLLTEEYKKGTWKSEHPIDIHKNLQEVDKLSSEIFN